MGGALLVGFDYQIFAEQEFGGISRYFCALATELSKQPGVRARILAPLHVNAYLRTGPAANATIGCYVRRLPKTGRLIQAASAGLFRSIARGLRPDVVHETYYASSPTCGLRVPEVITVHDMIHEIFPASFPRGDTTSRRKLAAARRADHIICVSHCTKRDLLERYHLPEDRVSVIYHGCDELPAGGPAVTDLVGNCEYLLYVGSRTGYKNFSGLLHAFAASSWLRSNFRLVCFGGGQLTADERMTMQRLGISELSVVHVGGGDDRLATLYRNASAFVYPSLYEGFGIPPLEAMSVGCPVICSQRSSIPEVVGDAGEYFEPESVDSIRAVIEQVLQSSTRRQVLVEMGMARHRQFTWERCARETLDVYRMLVR